MTINLSYYPPHPIQTMPKTRKKTTRARPRNLTRKRPTRPVPSRKGRRNYTFQPQDVLTVAEAIELIIRLLN
jgi:hypothetical protein